MLLDQETIRDLLPFWKDLRSISQKKLLEQMERVYFEKGVYLKNEKALRKLTESL